MATFNTGIFGEMHGRLSTVSFRRTRFGVQIIERAAPRNPRTPVQQANRNRLGQASVAWKNMTLEQAAAWRTYADAMGKRPMNVFVTLASRFMAVNPGQPVPLTPPTHAFGGDGAEVQFEAAPQAVRIEALRGNTSGVVTEVLFQPLGSIHCTTFPAHYRSQGFFPLEAGQVLELPARRGTVAVAIRFVRASTGQATGLLELGRVVVS